MKRALYRVLLWLILLFWATLVLGGILVFFTYADKATGWGAAAFNLLGWIFPFAWTGLLFIIERKFFKGLYDKTKAAIKKVYIEEKRC